MSKYIYGCKKDIKDIRDHIYQSKVSKESLPSQVDLRSKFSPVVDQGQLGSCTANAIVSGLREYQLLQKGDWKELSRLFLYYEERSIEGTIASDSGAEISDGMKVLQQIGVSPEPDYPYNIDKFTDAPTSQALADAPQYKIVEYHRITSLDLLKAAIAEGLPVVIGIDVYESFESDSVAQTGIIPMPDIPNEQLMGGHAICAVGYNDEKSLVTIRNSWGISWGDKGYGYLPYEYFNKLVSDMWTSTDIPTTIKGEDIMNDIATNTGSFSINVYDAAGDPIQGASISYSIDGVSLTATTDINGNSDVVGIPAGSYPLTIALSGYVSNTTVINISSAAITTVNVILSITLASIVQSLLAQLTTQKTAIATSLVDGIISKLENEEKTSSSIFVKNVRDPIELALLEQVENSTIPTLANIVETVLTELITTKLGATQKQ